MSQIQIFISTFSCYCSHDQSFYAFFAATISRISVMELCGGELAELSKLELMKRDDIQLEARDEE